MNIKEMVKKVIPLVFLSKIQKVNLYRITLKEYITDMLLFCKYSSTFSKDSQEKLESRIIFYYHSLEKGLSYTNLKFGFGELQRSILIDCIKKYIAKNYDLKSPQFITGVSVLNKYLKVHLDNGHELNSLAIIMKDINALVKFDSSEINLGGVIQFTKDEFIKQAKSDFKAFALSRYSLRDFTSQDVDLKLIEEAISIAQKSPSVCNRQSSRAYIVSEKQKIISHLEFQNGNCGFRNKVNKLIIITSSLHSFDDFSERNQCYIDGGLFGMSLLYALQYLEVGAVALNWCTTRAHDKTYKRFSNIPIGEEIIFMIGVGHVPEVFKVAKSERYNVKHVIRYL